MSKNKRACERCERMNGEKDMRQKPRYNMITGACILYRRFITSLMWVFWRLRKVRHAARGSALSGLGTEVGCQGVRGRAVKLAHSCELLDQDIICILELQSLYPYQLVQGSLMNCFFDIGNPPLFHRRISSFFSHLILSMSTIGDSTVIFGYAAVHLESRAIISIFSGWRTKLWVLRCSFSSSSSILSLFHLRVTFIGILPSNKDR